MSITLLNHVRDGVVAHLPAGTVADGRRASLTVRAALNGADAPAVPLTLLGPADARDLDPRAVIRMDPPPGAQGTEPNLFCVIEFDRPDLPWLFTPGAPDAAGRLQPWIALVVVEQREGVRLEDARGGRPALLHLDDPSELPPPDQLWAWAHAQVSAPAGTGAELTAALRGAPSATLSRLMCPRLLRPHTPYLACVVPTFESGRRAGAGQPDPEVAGPAWTATAVNGPLPVYHHWHFVTGAPGDFETLVRRIRATTPPAGMGTVDLDIGDPGADAVRAPGATLPFPGALRAGGPAAPAWNDPARQAALSSLVDAAAGPVVGPPLHGGAAAGVRAVPAGAQPRPHWLRDLNLDPRHRGAAALGARIVIENQEELMAAAWRQAGAIEEANRRLRAARLARRAGQAVVRRRLAPLGAGALLGVGAPALDRLPRRAGEPFRARLAATRLPLGLTEPAFRRLTRPGGHLGAHLVDRGGAPAVADAIDAGRAVPDRGLTGRPGGLVTLEGLIALGEAARAGAGAGGAVPVVVTELPATGPAARVPTVSGAPGRAGGRTLRLRIRDADRLVGGGSLTIDGVKAPSKAALGRMRAAARGELSLDALPGTGVVTVAGKEYALDAEIRAGLGEALREPAVPPVPAAPTDRLDALRAELLQALDPAVAVPAALAREVAVAHLRLPGEDPLDEVLAAPVIPAPLAPELAAISGDLLLPGADRMPADTCCALVTNPAYVQALLVGANHEMGRELRWRGFPTDQRGTVLHHFWDTRGTVAPPAEPAADIRDIHRFAPAGRLGAEVGGGRQDVVLLVRAEVFRRYPGTQVVAMPAVAAPGGRRPDYGTPALPRFRGVIGDDLHYFGFAFDDTTARGTGGATGWYAVFQQPPGAPRFGLDEAGADPATWPATPDGLTWSHVLPEAAAPAADGAAPTGHIRLPEVPTAFAGLAGVRWGAGGAAQARATWQQQVRVAIHFDDLLAVAP